MNHQICTECEILRVKIREMKENYIIIFFFIFVCWVDRKTHTQFACVRVESKSWLFVGRKRQAHVYWINVYTYDMLNLPHTASVKWNQWKMRESGSARKFSTVKRYVHFAHWQKLTVEYFPATSVKQLHDDKMEWLCLALFSCRLSN